MSKKSELESLCAYRDEVVVLSIVEACMKRKDKVIPAKLGKSSLLIKDHAAGNFSAGLGVLVDGFESIQVRRMLLSHEVNGRICSRTQSAQEIVIVEARVGVGRLGIDSASSL